MIKDKKTLKKYIAIDRIMNRGGGYNNSLKKRIITLLFPDYILRFLELYRAVEYYSDKKGMFNFLALTYTRFRCDRLMIKLGFSIEYNIFGYGLVLPHYGTIVVGAGNKIGNYCVLHTSTCITTGKKNIGDGFYLSTGAKVINDINIGDNVSVGANSLVNKECSGIRNSLVAGNPAKVIRDALPWYIRDGKEFEQRFKQCEEILSAMK